MKITGKIGDIPFEAMANMGVFAITLKHPLLDRADSILAGRMYHDMDECKRDLLSLLSAIGATIESEEA
jgi:hypothetical protein